MCRLALLRRHQTVIVRPDEQNRPRCDAIDHPFRIEAERVVNEFERQLCHGRRMRRRRPHLLARRRDCRAALPHPIRPTAGRAAGPRSGLLERIRQSGRACRGPRRSLTIGESMSTYRLEKLFSPQSGRRRRRESCVTLLLVGPCSQTCAAAALPARDRFDPDQMIMHFFHARHILGGDHACFAFVFVQNHSPHRCHSRRRHSPDDETGR